MPTYVCANGKFQVKPGINPDFVVWMLSKCNFFRNAKVTKAQTITAGADYVPVTFDFDKVYDIAPVEVYNAVSPYLTSAEVYFSDDWDQAIYWAQMFDGTQWTSYVGNATTLNGELTTAYMDVGKTTGTN